MIILLVILAIIVFILIVPIGASVGYVDEVFSLAARVLFFDIKLFPKKEKPPGKEKPPKKKKEKKPKKPKKKKPEPETPKPKPTLEELMELAGLGLDALGRLKRKIVINELMLHLTAADEDPYNAAMTYGYINGALGVMLPKLEKAFNVRKSDVQTAVDFESTKTRVDLRLTITLTLAKLLGVGIAAGFKFLKIKLKKTKEKARKEAEAERKDKDGTADGEHTGEGRQPDGGADEGQHDEDQGNGGREHDSGGAHNG